MSYIPKQFYDMSMKQKCTKLDSVTLLINVPEKYNFISTFYVAIATY